jgi:hypothetical protein
MKKWFAKYRFLWLVGLGIVAIGIIYGAREYNRSLPDTHSLNAAFHFNAGELLQQFEDDETSATKKYGGSVISVEGFIDSVQTTTGTVFLNGGNSLSSVMCQFDQKNLDEVLELRSKKLVTIKGLCSGYLMDVVMVRCVVEK